MGNRHCEISVVSRHQGLGLGTVQIGWPSIEGRDRARTAAAIGHPAAPGRRRSHRSPEANSRWAARRPDRRSTTPTPHLSSLAPLGDRDAAESGGLPDLRQPDERKRPGEGQAAGIARQRGHVIMPAAGRVDPHEPSHTRVEQPDLAAVHPRRMGHGEAPRDRLVAVDVDQGSRRSPCPAASLAARRSRPGRSRTWAGRPSSPGR